MRKNYGFTLVELVVAMAIIAVLSTLIVGAVKSARETARNTQRTNDLKTIQAAMIGYNIKNKHWIQTASGCGYNGNGTGWFNYSGGSYPKSIVQCLIDDGALTYEVIDPTRGRTSTPASGFSYMKYDCTLSGVRKVYIYAKLEGAEITGTETDGTCCASCDSSYGMNYYVEVAN